MAKKKKNEDLEEKYRYALQGKEIPLLVLDPKWHNLYPEHEKPSNIKSLEKKLNTLIKKQGNANTDLVELTKTKRELMKQIVVNMDDGSQPDSPAKFFRKDKSQRMIREINERLEEARRELETLPDEISAANMDLLVACMAQCYTEMVHNTREIDILQQKVLAFREELKQILLSKQDMEMKNTAMYSYMHDLLGARIMEVFDDGSERIWKDEDDSIAGEGQKEPET